MELISQLFFCRLFTTVVYINFLLLSAQYFLLACMEYCQVVTYSAFSLQFFISALLLSCIICLPIISPRSLLCTYLYLTMFFQIPLSFNVSILLLQFLLSFTSIIFLTYPTTLKFHLLLVLPFYLCSHPLPHPLSPTFLPPIFALSFSFHPYSLVSSLDCASIPS